MALPVVTVASGGLPVVEVAAGFPISEAANLRGLAVTKVVGGKAGLPVTFVAASSPAGDPFFINTKLLMGFNDVNNSVGAPGMTDESSSARGVAGVMGAGHIETVQFKFGASSLSTANGTGGVQYPDSPDWTLSSANSDQFTVELWVRMTTTAINKIFLAQYTTDGTVGWAFQTSGANANEFQFFYSLDGTFANNVSVTTTGAVLSTTLSVWHHIAVDKDATGKIRLYKNGVMLGSATPANSVIFNSPQPLGVGVSPAGAGAMDGWIDDVRITKGKARYASDAGFSVPTGAYPRF
jgi:hypothetical protein